MSNLFSEILNMSMTGSVVILLVMLVRVLLKRSPKVYSYVLWSVVLFRLLCPVAFTAPVSILDVMEPEMKEVSGNTSTVSYIPAAAGTYVDFVAVPQEGQPVHQGEVSQPKEELPMKPMHAAALVWAAGTAGMLLYSIVQYLRLKRKLIGAVLLRGNIYLADHIDTAFVVGLLQPRIYLPSGVRGKERCYIFAHEQEHIRRLDHVIKLLAYLALCIHWFNPLVWAAFILAGKDMEMSCDEAVINKLGADIRADYSASLLRLATGKKIIAGMPLAFGEGDTKGRVLNMAKWKKPRLWVSILCMVLCVAVLVACAVNPDQEKKPVSEETWSGAFELELPEGYEMDTDDQGNLVFTDGTKTIGGKRQYIAPEGYLYPDYFSRDFLIDMGLPEASDESLGYSGGGSVGGMGSSGWTAEYFSDVPPGIQMTVNTFHQFFVMEDGITIIDIWFDLLAVDNHTKEAILNSIEIPEIGRYALKPVNQNSLAAFSDENINILITCFHNEEGSGMADIFLLLSVDPDLHTVTMGSVLRDTYVSLPDFQGHTTGNDTFSACYALGKAWGGTQGAVEMVNQCMLDNFGITVDHNMELTGMAPGELTDVLNDMVGKLDGPLNHELQGISEQLLSRIAGNAQPEGIRQTKEQLAIAKWNDCTIPFEGSYIGAEVDFGDGKRNVLIMDRSENGLVSEEQEAFAKCRAVVEAVQKGSYKIISRQVNAGNEGPKGYERIYCRNREDWLSITNVLAEGENIADGMEYAATKSALYANGERYSYTGSQWVSIANDENSLLPWLADITWDESVVAYMDTLTDEEGACVMLRMDEKYVDSDDYDPHYFVNFNFDANGNFKNVDIQINLFRENEVTITESIASLDPETVNAEIQKEYQRAVA